MKAYKKVSLKLAKKVILLIFLFYLGLINTVFADQPYMTEIDKYFSNCARGYDCNLLKQTINKALTYYRPIRNNSVINYNAYCKVLDMARFYPNGTQYDMFDNMNIMNQRANEYQKNCVYGER